jgi:rhamnosyltransferase
MVSVQPKSSNTTSGRCDVAAVAILYEPTADHLRTVWTYASQVDRCFLIDNSAEPLPDRVRSSFRDGRVEYHHLGKNNGQAAALNYGIQLADQKGYRYVLTMDQDSRCSDRFVELLRGLFDTAASDGFPMAVACPFYLLPGAESALAATCEVTLCMTSGSLLDIKVWMRLGGFDETLFIDYVDHDFCLRAKRAGYRIVRHPEAILHHHTGTLKELRFLGIRRTVSIHSPERLLFMVRNGLVVKSRYGQFFPEIRTFVRRRMFAQAVKSLLLGPKRLRRIRFMLRGYFAFRAARTRAA